METKMYYQLPYAGHTKFELLERGHVHVLKFLELNHLPSPDFVLMDSTSQLGYCGVCGDKYQKVGVWARSTAAVSFNPSVKSRKWSYPGYRIDRTPIGVIAHEVGHWVDFIKRLHRGLPAKGKITGYEPSIYESVAESMRLFILNPDLLRIIAPERYTYILSRGIKPVVTETWDKVLSGAPEEYLKQIRKHYEKV